MLYKGSLTMAVCVRYRCSEHLGLAEIQFLLR